MKLEIGQEPDLVYEGLTSKIIYSPYRTYDINIWADDTHTLHITIYPVAVWADEPEEISGTDYEVGYYSHEYEVANKTDHEAIEWWLCDFLSCGGWDEMENLDEWDTYWGDTADFEAKAMGEKKPMPARIRQWLDSLPAYEPRKQER